MSPGVFCGSLHLVYFLGTSFVFSGYGNAFGDDTEELFSEMQAAIAALSRGPVQVSDGVGFSDRDVILRTCDAAGRLLQPSRPATALDAAFAAAAGLADGPKARIENVLPVMANARRPTRVPPGKPYLGLRQ